MIAYIDLIIFENFCMNLLLIYTTSKLLGKKSSKKRMALASLIGTVYVFSLCFKLDNITLNVSKILVGLVMVKVGLNESNIKVIFKDSIVYFFTSFLYAGCALGFLHIVKPKVVYIVNGIIIGGEYIFEILAVSAIFSFVTTKAVFKLVELKQYFNRKNMLCNIDIYNKKKKVRLRALLDTGNLLKDSSTGWPVIIVYKDKVKDLFSNKYMEQIEAMMKGGEINDNNIDYNGIRIIPFVSVGQSNGFLIASRVDKIKVEYQDIVNEINNVLIGFYNEALSKNDKYSALIGLQMLEGRKINNEHIQNVKSKGKYSVC